MDGAKMADSPHVTGLLRCPFCLCEMSVLEGWTPDTLLQCIRCHRQFEFGRALPGGESDEPETLPEPANEAKGARIVVLTTIIATLGILLWTLTLGREVRGPWFLIIFGGTAIAVMIAQWFVRHLWEDHVWVSWLALGLVLSFSLARYLSLLTHPDRNHWSGLVVLTLIGCLIQMLRGHHVQDSGGGWFGGCAGGGGCGGCGG
jgi:hypothetical protein